MWPGVYNFLRLMEGDIIYNYNALLTLVVTVTTSVSDKREQHFSMEGDRALIVPPRRPGPCECLKGLLPACGSRAATVQDQERLRRVLLNARNTGRRTRYFASVRGYLPRRLSRLEGVYCQQPSLCDASNGDWYVLRNYLFCGELLTMR